MPNLRISYVAGSTVVENGPDLDTATDARLRAYLYAQYPDRNENGQPLPATSAGEVRAFRAWARDQFRRVRAEVVDWERLERMRAVEAGEEFPE